jgi:ribosomal protein S18 acetylase RimI-like enzyme
MRKSPPKRKPVPARKARKSTAKGSAVARKPAAARRVPEVRALAARDLDAVVAIDAAIEGRTRRAYFERRLAAAFRAPKLYVQFAIDEGKSLTGYVLGRVLEGEFGRIEPAMRLEVIGVKPSARGRGLGAALERAIEAEARRRGLKEMRTGASWRDTAMLRFLDAAGYELGRNHVIQCTLGEATLGSSREQPVLVEERERPADKNDYGASAQNDFEALARDVAEVRSLARTDLDDIVRIDRRLMGQDRSTYIERKLEEALTESAIRISLVARKGGATAGFLMASADYGDFGRAEPVAVIDTIGVDPGFAHAGIGRSLLSQLFINLGALGIERVETVVAREHLELLRFFYHAGFGPAQQLSFVKRLGG